MDTLSEQITHRVRRYSDFLLPSIALVLVFILIPFQIIPSAKAITTLQGEVRQTLERKNLLETKERLLSLQDQGKLKTTLEKVNHVVPTTKDIPSIFANIGYLAQKNSLNLDLVQINAGDISVPYGTSSLAIELQVSLRGTEEQIRSFLKEIPQAGRLFLVRSVSVRPMTRASTTSDFVGSLVMNAYFQPLPETIGKIDEPISSLLPQEEKIATLLSEVSLPAESLPGMSSGRANPFSRF